MTVFLNFNFLFFNVGFPYFIFLSIFPSLFFPSFFLLHTPTLTFFSLFPSFLFFLTTSSTHMLLLFFFFSFFRLFPYYFTVQNVPHGAELFLPLSFSIFFLPVSLFSCQLVCKFLSLYPIKTHKFSWCFVDQNSTFKMYFSDQIRHK